MHRIVPNNTEMCCIDVHVHVCTLINYMKSSQLYKLRKVFTRNMSYKDVKPVLIW